MAEKRMFAKSVVDSDSFLDMPLTAQALYFHLGMRADDDGFMSSPKKVMRMIGSAEDDLRILAAKGFVIPFDSGIIVIAHWQVNNYLRKDRYTPTLHMEEMGRLSVLDNHVYALSTGGTPHGRPDGVPTGLPVVDAEKKREEKKREGKKRPGKDTSSTRTEFHAPVYQGKDENGRGIYA